ncbi:MAG: hypothetical protein NT094_02820 [Candidatus Staskawiczbacteria bacterium]|nr:hypothetical protein [Candidatus Staskawiczbacteria bacterium]
MGVIIANVISTNLFGILGLILCRKDLNFACFKNKFRYARKMIIYGLPFSMIMVIGTLLPSLDRFFLIRYTEYSQIAIYSISGKISSLLAFITDAFSLAFYPFAFSILDKNESAKIFEKIFQGYLFLFSFLAVLITAFSSTIIQVLFGSDYFKATMFLPPLLMANFFQAMLEFTLLGIFISKKTIFNLIIYLLGIAVLFISNFFLVPVFFIMGAAVSLLITKILMNVFAYLISRRLYHLHLDFVLVFKTLILVCGYFLIFYLNCNFPNYFLQKLNILSSILFPVASFYIILSTSDRSRIINEGRKLLRFREL